MLKENVILVTVNATADGSGTLTFNLTEDGTSNGTAIFSEVFKNTCCLWVDDVSYALHQGGYTLSGNLKQLTFNLRYRTFTSGIISLITVLLGTALSNLPNGVVVHLSVFGKRP